MLQCLSASLSICLSLAEPDVSWYEDICLARGLKAWDAADPRGYHLPTDDRWDIKYIRNQVTKSLWIQTRRVEELFGFLVFLKRTLAHTKKAQTRYAMFPLHC